MSDWAEINRQTSEAKHLFLNDRRTGEEMFSKLLITYPHDGMVYFQRGECYEEIGDYGLAIEDYRRAYKAFPLERFKNKASQAIQRIESNSSQFSQPIESTKLFEKVDRARELALTLFQVFSNPSMPEDNLPRGCVQDSPEYRLFLTLTVAIDYLRDADSLWNFARSAFENPQSRFLYDPKEVLRRSDSDLERILRSTKLLNDPKDLYTWKTLCKTVLDYYKGDPLNIILACNWDGAKVLEHLHQNGQLFPYLKGQKIGPLWLRMLRDNAGLPLTNLDTIPIPVDIQVLRATFCSGAITGDYDGPIEPLKKMVAPLWKKAVQGLSFPDKNGTGRPLISLDLDEALWNLGRNFCSRNGRSPMESCPLSPGCLSGKIEIRNNMVQIKSGNMAIQSRVDMSFQQESPRVLGILGCTKSKVWDRSIGAGPTPAIDVYKGSKFLDDLKIVDKQSNRWIIFSAYYGFIDPDFVIPESYDVTFNSPYDKIKNPTILQEKLVRQINANHLNSFHMVRLLSSCGGDYESRVREAFKGFPVRVERFS